MNLSTVERVKAILEIPSTEETQDALLGQLLTQVSVAAEKRMKRRVQTGEVVETFDPFCGQRVLQLSAYPVTAVDVVAEDPLGVFDGDEVEIGEVNYRVNRTAGLLHLVSWEVDGNPQSLRVTYTGGMAATPSAFVTAYPDIAGAVDLQVAMLYRRLSTLGTTATSVAGQATSTQEPIRWLPYVADVLDAHRLPVAGG